MEYFGDIAKKIKDSKRLISGGKCEDMTDYVGKTKVFNEVKEHVDYSDMPKCKDCSYSKFKGLEKLTFCVSGDDDSILLVECLRASYGLRIEVKDFDSGKYLSSDFYK